MALPQVPSSANQITLATGVAGRLASVIGWDPSWALEVDDAAPEKLRRDPVVAGAFDHLQRLIVGHDWFMEAGGKTRKHRELATVVEDLQRQTERLPSAWYNLAAASFMGATWGLARLERRVLKLGDGKPREWTVVARVRDVDKRRFRMSRIASIPTPQGDVSVRVRSPSLERRAISQHGVAEFSGSGVLGPFRWEFHPGFDYRPNQPQWWTPLETVAPKNLWIQHVVDDSERGLGFGYGMMEDVWTYFWMKQQALKWGMQGLERWGEGFLVYRAKALLDGMSRGTTQAAQFAAVVANIRKWRTENFAAMGIDDELQLLDMPATAEAAVREWIKYFDQEITKRVLVALQPTGGADGAGGGFSSAKVEEGSTDAAVAYLRAPLEETWSRGIVRNLLLEENRDNLRELGLEDLEPPRLRLRGKEHHDLDQVIQLFLAARDLKMPVRREDFYSMTGLTQPNEEDDAVTFEPAQTPGAGLGALGQPGASSVDLADLLGDGRDRAAVGEGGTAVGEKNGRQAA